MEKTMSIFKRLLYIGSFLAIAIVICEDLASAQTVVATRSKPWLRCILSGSSTGSLTSIAVNYGFVVGVEANNGNLLSVDTYQLNIQGQLIKQISHAEAKSQTTSTSSGSGLNILNSADSPTTFSLSSAGTSTTNKFSAVVSDVLFTGQSISSMPVTCKLNLPKTT